MSDFIESFSVDKSGNLYYNNFWININKEDHIDFYEVNLNKDNLQKVSKDVLLKEDPLQVKVIEKELEELQKKINNNEEEQEFEETEVLHLQNYIYNPELKYIKSNHKDKLVEEETSDNEDWGEPYLEINGDFNIIDTDFELSNYEVFFVNEFNNLVSYTEIKNDNPFYRITIYPSNKIQLNIIGTKTITYKLKKIETKIDQTKIDQTKIDQTKIDFKPFDIEVISINYQNLN